MSAITQLVHTIRQQYWAGALDDTALVNIHVGILKECGTFKRRPTVTQSRRAFAV